jgi:hypothetical protein
VSFGVGRFFDRFSFPSQAKTDCSDRPVKSAVLDCNVFYLLIGRRVDSNLSNFAGIIFCAFAINDGVALVNVYNLVGHWVWFLFLAGDEEHGEKCQEQSWPETRGHASNKKPPSA